jgi:branched-chain amino acid aminotransferase
MSTVIYVSGRYQAENEATVHVLDHGLLYGDGVFEGIRAYNGRLFKLDRHIERLYQSALAMRIAIPHAPSELAGIVVDTCRRNGIEDGYVRLVITRGRGGLGIDPSTCRVPEVIVIARPQIALYKDISNGVTMVTSSFRRPSADSVSPSIKSLNYVNNVLARMEASDRGADEALLLDNNGFVAEASADNVFIVTPTGLATPPIATNLNGITRETVVELAIGMHVPCEVRFFNLYEVWTAREVFICGTGAEIVPVLSVDGRPIGTGQIGPMTRRFVDAYHRLVQSTGTPIRAAAASAGVPAPSAEAPHELPV